MADLQGEAKRRRRQAQELVEAADVDAEVRRELEEDRAQASGPDQRPHRGQEPLEQLVALAEPLDVGQLLVELEGELEPARHAVGPLADRALGRHAIERVVDLDGRKLPSVESEHLPRREPGRIERALPGRIGVTGGADAELGHRGVPGQAMISRWRTACTARRRSRSRRPSGTRRPPTPGRSAASTTRVSRTAWRPWRPSSGPPRSGGSGWPRGARAIPAWWRRSLAASRRWSSPGAA